MTDLLLSDTHIPATFRDVSYDDYKVVDRRTGDALDSVIAWRPTRRRPNLLLIGPPDRGKTMLAAATLNDYQADLSFTYKHTGKPLPATSLPFLRQRRFPVYFIQLAELISLSIRSFKLFDLLSRDMAGPDEYLDLDQLLKDLRERAEVLVVDDVGKEHHTSSGFAEDEFDQLVRTRYNNGLPTIFTSNLPLYRWASDYSESMRSLLERSSLIVKL